jgi:hypothetical protein
MHSIEDRCEGTLVVHAAGDAECTEPNCLDAEYVFHSLVLDCSDVTGGCRCTVGIDLARAS